MTRALMAKCESWQKSAMKIPVVAHKTKPTKGCRGATKNFIGFVFVQLRLWGAQAASLHFSAACRKDLFERSFKHVGLKFPASCRK
jgi:hypothetical protein